LFLFEFVDCARFIIIILRALAACVREVGVATVCHGVTACPCTEAWVLPGRMIVDDYDVIQGFGCVSFEASVDDPGCLLFVLSCSPFMVWVNFLLKKRSSLPRLFR
jgi:hypothetical protein